LFRSWRRDGPGMRVLVERLREREQVVRAMCRVGDEGFREHGLELRRKPAHELAGTSHPGAHGLIAQELVQNRSDGEHARACVPRATAPLLGCRAGLVARQDGRGLRELERDLKEAAIALDETRGVQEEEMPRAMQLRRLHADLYAESRRLTVVQSRPTPAELLDTGPQGTRQDRRADWKRRDQVLLRARHSGRRYYQRMLCTREPLPVETEGPFPTHAHRTSACLTRVGILRCVWSWDALGQRRHGHKVVSSGRGMPRQG